MRALSILVLLFGFEIRFLTDLELHSRLGWPMDLRDPLISASSALGFQIHTTVLFIFES